MRGILLTRVTEITPSGRRRVAPRLDGLVHDSTMNNTVLPQRQTEVVPTTTWADLLKSIPSPKSLVDHLDRNVVGQQTAKRKLAIAVSNHFKRIVDRERSTV
jgi:ATP-dependent protease Clp ATPase subunit